MTYVHFVGIGGIGMSALAKYFLDNKVQVSGYDRVSSRITDQLIELGAHIYFDSAPSYEYGRPDYIIYTPAVPSDHEEFIWAARHKVERLKRSTALGAIAQDMKTIAVAGTHGKTSTSAMVLSIMRKLDVNFTGIVGGWINEIEGNYFYSGKDWMVTEADEFDRSFLTLFPQIAIINSLDADHLDIYGDAQKMILSYVEFIEQVRHDGKVIIRYDLIDQLRPYLSDEKLDQLISFGESEEADYSLKKITREAGVMIMNWMRSEGEYQSQIPLPGKYNALNALAAMAACIEAGKSEMEVAKAIGEFKGIHRRFEKRFENEEVIIIDDYAHHPTEINAVVEAVRWLYPNRRLVGVFQSHTYTRTRDFMIEFADSLKNLDVLYTCELYAARENPIDGVSGKVLYENVPMKNKHYFEKENLAAEIQWKRDDIILILGAGNIDSIIPELIKRIEEK